jgi:CRISPR-associated protein Cas1
MAIVKHLIAEQFGTHIGKYSERLIITHKGEKLAQAPLMHLEDVTVLSLGVSISADALAACAERGIPVYFIDSQGTPYATMIASGLVGTVLTRREQLRAYDDGRGLSLALVMAAGKIENQAINLKYFAKNRADTPEGEALRLAATAVAEHTTWLEPCTALSTVDEARERILAAEGNAARAYWSAIRLVIPPDYGWESREGRGALDPINSLLNYGYGILYREIERALVLAGLDPYAGFLHADRPGKPSLVLDLIEEFRAFAVDRVVVGLANRHFVVERDERALLSEGTRRSLAEHVIAQLDGTVKYAHGEGESQRHMLRHVIQMQARQLATFLRQERPAYLPFRAGW